MLGRFTFSVLAMLIAPGIATHGFYNASSHFHTEFSSPPTLKLPALPLSVQGTLVVDSVGTEVPLACVNWYGAHMELYTVGGLHRQPLQAVVAKIAEFGFNCIRLPFSLDLWYLDPVVPEHALAANPDLFGLTGMQLFDLVIQACSREGIMVILNNHNSEAGWCCDANSEEGLWTTSKYSTTEWIEVLTNVTQRYKGRGLNVVGMDLRNEVHDVVDKQSGATTTEVTWGSSRDIETDWKTAAEAAGKALLAVDDTQLVMVSGLCFSYVLHPIVADPPDLPRSKTLLTAHVYPWSHWWVVAENNGVDFATMRAVAAAVLPLAVLALAGLWWLGVAKKVVRAVVWEEVAGAGLLWCGVLCASLAVAAAQVSDGVRKGGCKPATAPIERAKAGCAAGAGACCGLGAVLVAWVVVRRRWDGGGGGAAERAADGRGEEDGGSRDRAASAGKAEEEEEGTGGGWRVRGVRAGWVCGVVTAVVVAAGASVLLWVAERRGQYALLQGELRYQWGMDRGSMPIYVGEFGTAEAEGRWWGHVTRFLRETRLPWAYWAVDGGKWWEESGRWRDETYGILSGDYHSVRSEQKLRDLQRLIPAP